MLGETLCPSPEARPFLHTPPHPHMRSFLPPAGLRGLRVHVGPSPRGVWESDFSELRLHSWDVENSLSHRWAPGPLGKPAVFALSLGAWRAQQACPGPPAFVCGQRLLRPVQGPQPSVTRHQGTGGNTAKTQMEDTRGMIYHREISHVKRLFLTLETFLIWQLGGKEKTKTLMQHSTPQ